MLTALTTLAALTALAAAVVLAALLTTLLALTSGLLILLAGFLLTALLARILVLIAHEATPLCGTIPREANHWAQLWFLMEWSWVNLPRLISD